MTYFVQGTQYLNIRPYGIIGFDFDGDGFKDLFSTSAGCVLFNEGTNSYSAGVALTPIGYANSFALIGDFNGDGFNDIIYTPRSSTSIQAISFGNQSGSFSDPVKLFAPWSGWWANLNGTIDALCADFNGDGRMDFAFAADNQAGLFVAIQSASGYFSDPIYLSGGYGAYRNTFNIQSADIDRDGDVDLVSSNPYGLSVYMNSGAGSFIESTISFPHGSTFISRILDVNMDGKLDILSVNSPTSYSVLFGDGSGGFSAPVTTGEIAASGYRSRDVFLVDMNLDGISDLVTIDPSTGAAAVFVYYGVGDGSFNQYQKIALADFSYVEVEVVDNNGDGWLDILASDPNSGILRFINAQIPETSLTNNNDAYTGTLADDIVFGLDGDDTINGGAGRDRMAGGAGNDTYIVGSVNDIVIEANGEGVDTIYSTVNFTTDANVENIVLLGQTAINATGNDLDNYLTGNGAENHLYGEGGNDTLDGGTGNDSMAGGVGNDTYMVDAVGDVVIENNAEGTDVVQSSVSYVLGSNVENLTLTGGAAINATGNALNNVLTGNSANNTLDGGTGNDSMAGGVGNDTYMVDAVGDVVIESNAEGTDVVQSSVSYVLGSNVENLTLTGGAAINATGNALANVITGNSGDNRIAGGGGNDTMLGGSGNDTLEGGIGNDSVVGGDGQDMVSYANATSAVTVSLALTAAQNTIGAGTDTIASIEDVIGSAFNDRLTGDSAANTLEGGAGNDTLTGGDGSDTASYASAAAGVTVSLALATAQNTVGAGTDTLATFENLLGSGFNDVLTGSTTANFIDGSAGNDTITGGGGADTLLGGDGDDMFVFALAVDLAAGEAITGGNGTDEIRFTTATASTLVLTSGVKVEKVVIGTGTAAAAVTTATTAINIDASAAGNGLSILGNAGVNSLTGSAFADSIDGGAGNDILIGGLGNDTLNGNAGTDTANYSAAAENLTLSLAILTGQSVGSFGTDTFMGIENLTTGSGNDQLIGDANANTLIGGAGNDTIDGGSGNDIITGGDGSDTASYASAAAGVTVSLALTTAQNTVGAGTDTLATFENLLGSSFNDILNGNANANRIDGGTGNDVITGGAGTDTLNGGDGSDIYMLTVAGDKTAAEIADTGTFGVDELRFAATVAGTLTLNSGDTGLERVVIGTGSASVAVSTATTALNVNASAATNGLTLIGNAGVNSLTGTGFNDSIDGGAGNDSLTGGAGNDTIYGGLGNDTLLGGAGSDVFVFNTTPNASSNRDTISDFVSASDDIWLSKAVMTGLGSTTGALSSTAFWSGAGVVAGHDADDRIIYNSATGALYYDADGNGSTAAVQIAQLTANTALTYQDFFII